MTAEEILKKQERFKELVTECLQGMNYMRIGTWKPSLSDWKNIYEEAFYHFINEEYASQPKAEPVALPQDWREQLSERLVNLMEMYIPDGEHIATYKLADWVEENVVKPLQQQLSQPVASDAVAFADWMAEHIEGSYFINGKGVFQFVNQRGDTINLSAEQLYQLFKQQP